MAELGSAKKTVEVLQRHDFHTQKRFGQNFLVDARVLEKIVDASEATKEDCVLEIGPGIGTMTQRLARRAGSVIAVEIDKNLMPVLRETLSEYHNVTLLNEDILKVDVAGLAREKNGGRPFRVVANLPYYITTPIVMGLLESRAPVKSLTLMVQKEVAERMQTGPGSKEYGALSLAVQYYASPRIIANVPSNCFLPRPGVSSAVIHLACYEEPPVEADEERLFCVIRAAFNQRRKTLANALANAPGLSVTRQQAAQAIERTGLSPTVRGEVLTLRQFAALCRELP